MPNALLVLPLVLAVSATLLAAGAEPSQAACVTDDTGTEVCLDASPARVVSLYGAFTELLWDLGMGGALVARTSNDDTIPEVAALPSVGTGLRPDVEHLLARRPDLVVSRGGRASREALSALRARGLPVAAFDPGGIDDLEAVVARLGALCGRETQAQDLVARLRERLTAVAERIGAPERRPRVVFEVRAEPLTVAGAGGLVDEVIRRAGGVNAVESDKKLLLFDVEALLRLDPDVYVVQEGPMNRNPPALADRAHLRLLRAARTRRVLVVDETLFSRPGPRVAEAVEHLSRFLYPERWE